MVSLGGFPGLVPTEEENDIFVETYEIDEETNRSIEGLEGYPRFYGKDKVQTSIGECDIYVLNKQYDNEPKVESGIW